MAAEKPAPHAVCLPYPAQGHIAPMLNVAKLLHARGFHVTFVNSEYNHARLVRTRGAAAMAGVPGFRFATIPDGMPAPPGGVDADVTQDIPSLCKSTTQTCLGPFRSLLAELNGMGTALPSPASSRTSSWASPWTRLRSLASPTSSSGRPAPSATSEAVTTVSSSTAVSPHLKVSIEHTLWAGSLSAPPLTPAAFPTYMHAWAADMKQLMDGYLDMPVEDVPGLRSMRLRDFPTFIRATDPDDFMVGYAIKETERAASASAVILNSFDDLEGEAVETMEALLGNGKRKVYTVGPLTLLAPRSIASTIITSLGLWKEQEECLQWLHGEEPGSVVYVNFGSIVVMSSEQLVEFAWGLANSGRHFLWVIRPDLVRGDAAVLPPEFMTETAGRGLMSSWCPQQEVLNHPAVGAFLTHSGWNSALESVCGGVPVLSWPFFADQQTNCRYQCKEWGVGMEIDNNVQRDAVAGLIAELMDGEKGKQMRKRAEEWREKAILAAKPGGSSHRNFDELVRDVLLPKS